MERHNAIIRYYKREIIPDRHKEGDDIRRIMSEEGFKTEIDNPILNENEEIYLQKLNRSVKISEVIKTDVANTVVYVIDYVSEEEPIKAKDYADIKLKIDKDKQEALFNLNKDISKWKINNVYLHNILNNIEENISKFKEELSLKVYYWGNIDFVLFLNENKYDFVEKLGFDYVVTKLDDSYYMLTKNTFDYKTEYFALEKKYDKLLEDMENIKNIVNSK